MKLKPNYFMAYTFHDQSRGDIWCHMTAVYGRMRYIINHNMAVDPEGHTIMDWQFFAPNGIKCKLEDAITMED